MATGCAGDASARSYWRVLVLTEGFGLCVASGLVLCAVCVWRVLHLHVAVVGFGTSGCREGWPLGRRFVFGVGFLLSVCMCNTSIY